LIGVHRTLLFLFRTFLLARALAQVKLGQLQVARLGNLQINLRTVDYGHRLPGAR
jgi:hypothetical protein